MLSLEWCLSCSVWVGYLQLQLQSKILSGKRSPGKKSLWRWWDYQVIEEYKTKELTQLRKVARCGARGGSTQCRWWSCPALGRFIRLLNSVTRHFLKFFKRSYEYSMLLEDLWFALEIENVLNSRVLESDKPLGKIDYHYQIWRYIPPLGWLCHVLVSLWLCVCFRPGFKLLN